MDDALPAALTVGISFTDFWAMTPADLKACIQGKRKAAELDFSLFNQKAWLQGAYVQQAVGSVMAKGVKYPKEPISIEPPMTPEERATHDRERLRAYLDDFAARHNAKWAKAHPQKTEQTAAPGA